MRRLTRILANAATVVSLALGLATVALWVRSYRVVDRIVVTYAYSPGLPPLAALAQGNRRPAFRAVRVRRRPRTRPVRSG